MLGVSIHSKLGWSLIVSGPWKFQRCFPELICECCSRCLTKGPGAVSLMIGQDILAAIADVFAMEVGQRAWALLYFLEALRCRVDFSKLHIGKLRDGEPADFRL